MSQPVPRFDEHIYISASMYRVLQQKWKAMDFHDDLGCSECVREQAPRIDTKRVFIFEKQCE